MLVLSRKVDEAVLVGPHIEVFVFDIVGDKVRLGFRAPEDVVVIRSDLYKRIAQKRPEEAERIWTEGVDRWRSR